MPPVKVASELLHETSAVSLFTHLPTPTLLAARGTAAGTSHSQYQSRQHAHLFCVLPHGFRGRERLLAVYLSCNNNIRSFIGNLWHVLLLGNHLKLRINKTGARTLHKSFEFYPKAVSQDFTVRHYSRSRLTEGTSEGWIEDKMTSDSLA